MIHSNSKLKSNEIKMEYSHQSSISTRIRRRERTNAAASSRQSPAELEGSVADFWSWVRKGGAGPTPAVVNPSLVPEGLGLLARRDASRNEAVLEVPKSLWINSETVAGSEVGSLCHGLRPWASIALFLLREMALGSSSPWSPYLRILPDSTDSPIFW